MAIIWQKQTKHSRYEVRSAGHSVRLYTDGLFHSQWNDRTPFTGALWELMFLPTCFVSNPNTIKDILILGVGGGAIINLINRFLTPKQIVGVDLDKTHLYIAKRFFHVELQNTQLRQAEARQWVGQCRRKFDLIIEDLFTSDDEGEPVRAIEADAVWLSQLNGILKNRGIVVMNHDSRQNLSNTVRHKPVKKMFACGYCFYSDRYENAIGVFSKAKTDKKIYSVNCKMLMEQKNVGKNSKLDYQLVKLF